MGIDLKKSKPGLDLQKKPVPRPPAGSVSKGLDLNKEKPGLDLRKTSHAGAVSENPTNANPSQKPPSGKIFLSKWVLLPLLIVIAAITYVLWPKIDANGTSNNGTGQQVTTNAAEYEAGNLRTGKNNDIGSEGSSTSNTNPSEMNRATPTVSEGKQSEHSKESVVTGSMNTDGTTTKVVKNRHGEKNHAEPMSKNYSCYTQNRDPIIQDDIKLVLQFGFNDTALDANDKSQLDQFIANYPKNTASTIRIDGFACNIGSEMINYEVSQARAISVQNYLKNSTIGSSVQILVSAFGSNYPIADNNTPKGRSQNRRAVISYD